MTIGIVVSGLVEAYVRDICKGVSRLAKQEDVNVVIIPAKYYGHDYELNFEYPYIYQFNSPRIVSLIIFLRRSVDGS